MVHHAHDQVGLETSTIYWIFSWWSKYGLVISIFQILLQMRFNWVPCIKRDQINPVSAYQQDWYQNWPISACYLPEVISCSTLYINQHIHCNIREATQCEQTNLQAETHWAWTFIQGSLVYPSAKTNFEMKQRVNAPRMVSFHRFCYINHSVSWWIHCINIVDINKI